MLPRHFDYIFEHLRQKVRLRPEIFVNFRPEPDPTYHSDMATPLQTFTLALHFVISAFAIKTDGFNKQLVIKFY